MDMKDLRQAWSASPGPRNGRDAGGLVCKGFLMGAADIIPGVSGGTMAFITGIYSDLIAAVRSFDFGFVRRLARFDFTGAVAGVHLRFLAPLLLGIITAILSMSRLMHYMLANHPVQVWSLFFGLIAASILVVGKRIGEASPDKIFWAVLGALGSYLLVGAIPVSTPEALWFIFLCGMIAICAMILPGISGAFILLILGKYEFITATLKNPFDPANLLIIFVFVAGCVLGIAGFSRILHYFLTHHHAAAVSLLTGFMAGALRKVWPFKEVLQTEIVRGKEVVIKATNVLPVAYDAGLVMAIGLMAAGLVFVLVLDRLTEVGD